MQYFLLWRVFALVWDTGVIMNTLPAFLTLRRFNNALTALVIAFALYLILLPFVPALGWWIQHQAPLISKPPTVAAVEKIPDDNELVIPSIGLQQATHEGANKWTLHFGVWHLPGTGNPATGGNTVLAGHRFTYHDPAVFYHLDKVKTGDPIIMYWNHKKYTYKVTTILTVPPTEVSVQAPTKEPLLTIYTCTPLWTSKYRLVLQAKPVEAS
jgi:LPXTG-site transpeptidase (sortase) family protein